MTKSVLYDLKGKSKGEQKLSKDVFGVPMNKSLIHLAAVNYMASQRSGTASAKTRAEVRGGGKKPWRQKGTGRARAGSTRSPLWNGGGVIFGPKQRDYSFDMPKRQKRAAIRIMLSEKLRAKKLTLIESVELKEAKTKEMVKMLEGLKLNGKTLLVDEAPSQKIKLAARNLKNVKLVCESDLNIYDLLSHENLLMTKGALTKIEERLVK